MFGIRKKAAKTAKRAGLLTGGLLLCTVGAGFLTLAGWLALVPIVSMQMTATIIAAIYLGIGLIMIGIGVRSETAADQPVHQPQAAADGPPILQAFMYGLQAGAQSDQTRH
ncbi:phage holin family protein [Yoonia sp. SS1-5]|uniref:Phage holin family protein n=1 Tax=Yoonia rhodophyticola TaxID=3137370 RepID=A0AAN0MAQ7_9RHOB